MTFTRSEIRANRRKWAAFLMEPGRKKAVGFLDRNNDERCCLGHGCACFGIKQTVTFGMTVVLYGKEQASKAAPVEFVELVGLWNDCGFSLSYKPFIKGYPRSTLTGLNDQTDLTPYQIGEYILTVIDGGPDAPFRPLTEYPE